MLSLFIATLEISIVSTSLVTITDDFHAFGSSIWIVIAYLLTYTGTYMPERAVCALLTFHLQAFLLYMLRRAISSAGKLPFVRDLASLWSFLGRVVQLNQSLSCELWCNMLSCSSH